MSPEANFQNNYNTEELQNNNNTEQLPSNTGIPSGLDDTNQSDKETSGSENSVPELNNSGPELDNSGRDLDLSVENPSNRLWWGPDKGTEEMLRYYDTERNGNSEDFIMTQEENF